MELALLAALFTLSSCSGVGNENAMPAHQVTLETNCVAEYEELHFSLPATKFESFHCRPRSATCPHESSIAPPEEDLKHASLFAGGTPEEGLERYVLILNWPEEETGLPEIWCRNDTLESAPMPCKQVTLIDDVPQVLDARCTATFKSEFIKP